jgi:oligogalacturonide lyase
MAKAQRFPAERRSFRDRRTGTVITQLTDYKGHSYPLYFTNSGWWDGGRKLLFGSDRGNRSNLYSLELSSGEITQLTDRSQPPPPAETSLLFASLNPRREEAYYWYGRQLIALDLVSLEERTLYTAPAGFLTNLTSVTADGAHVCTGLYEDLSDRFPLDLLHGYVGFREYWQAKPWSRVVRIDTGSGRADTLFEEAHWIGHVNTSPTQPQLLSYCHEGPWGEVDNRIWGIDAATGRNWAIRPAAEGANVGHEYWLADGEHLGYHGGYHGRAGDGTAFFGSVRFDNTEHNEAAFPYHSQHVHSNDLKLIVGDGNRERPQLLLWRYRNGRFERPRLLAEHHSAAHVQVTHVHPRFTADGSQVLYTSDASGYGNLYLAELPVLETLPEASG